MSLLPRAIARVLLAAGLLLCAGAAKAQTAFAPEASEYPIVGTLPGDQTFPSVGLNAQGGYVVWQDNASDESGLGISARRLNANLSGTFASFRVNKQTAGDQDQPKVAMLKGGGAVIVWRSRGTNIQARFVKPDGTFVSDSEVTVNTYAGSLKLAPCVAAMSDGAALVIWSSQGQDGSMQGIYGQRLSAEGEKIGVEFIVNETTALNQRTPAVAGLPDGAAVVTWISESGLQATGAANIDVFARILGTSGPLRTQHEFKASDTGAICANPVVASAEDGSFTIAWSQRDKPATNGKFAGTSSDPSAVQVQGDVPLNVASWDVFGRSFNLSGTAKKPSARVNSYTYGQQFGPQIAALHGDYMVIWTSYAQDQSQEGVYGQFMNADGALVGPEFGVNSTTISKQMQPAVAANGDGRFLAVWTSFIGGSGSFDLFAQRFTPTTRALVGPPAPFVSAASSTRLNVSWAPLDGYQVDHYELFMDDASAPITVTNTMYAATRLVPASSHSFKYRYVVAGGQVSPISVFASGTTWDEDNNGDGLPDDWQAKYWGPDSALWPGKDADSDGDGASNLQELLAGTDPKNASSTLRTSLTHSSQGTRLNWNTVPGSIYQVQVSGDLRNWSNLGVTRFAAGASDSMLLQQPDIRKSYYRLIRLR